LTHAHKSGKHKTVCIYRDGTNEEKADMLANLCKVISQDCFAILQEEEIVFVIILTSVHTLFFQRSVSNGVIKLN
jgi:hypothetical protein